MITIKKLKRIENRNIRKYIKEIDKSILVNHGKFNYEKAVILENLHDETINKIKYRYIKAGWNYVYHKKGWILTETIFCFSMVKLDDRYITDNNFIMTSAEYVM